MKAYRSADGEIVMFRPDKNMDRMHNSAIRSALPGFDKVPQKFHIASEAFSTTDENV